MQRLPDAPPMLAQGAGWQSLAGQGSLVTGQFEGRRADPGTRVFLKGRFQSLPGCSGARLAIQIGDPGGAPPPGGEERAGRQAQEPIPGTPRVQPSRSPSEEGLGAGRPGPREGEGQAVPRAEVHVGYHPIGRWN